MMIEELRTNDVFATRVAGVMCGLLPGCTWVAPVGRLDWPERRKVGYANRQGQKRGTADETERRSAPGLPDLVSWPGQGIAAANF